MIRGSLQLKSGAKAPQVEVSDKGLELNVLATSVPLHRAKGERKLNLRSSLIVPRWERNGVPHQTD